MKHLKTLFSVLGECFGKVSKGICICLIIFVCFFSMAAANPVNAEGGTSGTVTLYSVSPLLQQMKLLQPSSVIPGGRGYMLPQVVAAKDSSGNPVSGVAITFLVSTDNYVSSIMRGSNSKSITVTTDANGIASAANTYQGYVGEGYQVYSKYNGIIKTLQVTASAQDTNTITFSVQVGTYGSSITDTTPPTITASAADDTGASYTAGTWTNHTVTVHYTAADTLSNISFCTEDQTFADEGANQIATGVARDSAATSESDVNHTSSVTFSPINIDKSAPTTTATATPAYGDIWNNGTVSVSFNAVDSISGIAALYYKIGDNETVVINDSNATVNISSEGITNISYWAVDQAGNTETAKTITVKVDQTTPALTHTLSPEKNENGWNSADVTVNLTAADTYSGVNEIHYKIGESGTEQVVQGQQATFTVNTEGVIPITFWAVDNVDNTSTVQTFNVKLDKAAPIITVPQNITIEATAVNTSINIGTATVTDVSPDVTLTNDVPTGGFPIGTTSVIWTARDQVGNVTTAVQTITVLDTTKPVISVQGDIVLEATAVNTPVTLQKATATDIFSIIITSDAPDVFPIGETTVTWTATDANNNSITAVQNVTVIDSTKPVLTLPQNITIEATGTRTIVPIGTATATDIFQVVITSDAPADYPVGATTVAWKATDANGNISMGEQVINVVDTIKPVLAIPEDITLEATALRTPVAIGQATATDIFDVTITNDAPTDFPIGTTIITWTAIDENNNKTTAEQKVIVKDTTKPVLTIPNNVTLEATAVRTAVSIGQATATDIFEVTITNNAPSNYPVGNTVITWTATDANGNVTTREQIITVTDTTKPLLSIPGDKTVEATAVRTLVNIGQAAATDIFETTIVNDAPADYPLGTTIVTWTATDANGNISTVKQNITVKDTTKPILQVPQDITIEAIAIKTPVVIGMATATEIFPVTITIDAPADYPIGTTKVTWMAEDASGNISLGYQNITVMDTTVPVLTVPEDIPIEATAVRTPVTIGEATAVDIFSITIVNDAPADYPVGTTKVTWTATDANGNISTGVQNVTVTDTTKPVLTVPNDMTVEATAVRTPVSIGMATATDIFSVTIVSNAPSDYPLGKTVVTWKATDENGNISEGTQIITVVDTTVPAFIAPENLTIEATAVETEVDLVSPVVTDIFGFTITSDAPASYPIGATTVTWTATDANGNVSTAVQSITIVDTTKPVLTLPENKTVEATAVSTPVEIGTATATDIFGVTITSDAPVSYPIGITTVTWTATDANGNVSTAVQTITIVDTTKPVLTLPENKTVEATALNTPVEIGTATATDIFGVTVTSDAPVSYSIGATTVTWTATDANGNVSTAVKTITIVDTTKPVLTLPENKTVEATAVSTPVEIGTATATDIFGVTVTSDAPVSYSIGATTVTWTATDANGNVSTAVQTITIVDTTKPVLTLPENKTVEATAVNTPVEIGAATATDIFGVTVTSDAPVSYPIGITTVTWTATDANGNVSTAVQTITIVDTTKPVLTLPENKTVEATALNTPVEIGTATATDIFGVTVTNDAPVSYPIGATTVTWTATDANGNVSTAVQTITIVDTTKPVLTLPENKTVEATAVNTPVEIGTATATDIFGVTITSDALASYPIGITTVTWTATDANGNVSTAVQTITIVDTTKPVLTLPENKTVEATAVNTPVEIGTATATDIFGVTITSDALASYPIGITTVTWTATDANGNVSTAVQTITIVDTTKPVLTLPENKTVEATAVNTLVEIGTATATDIFGVTITSDALVSYSIGATTVTWTATDANGNVSTAVQTITIVDTTKPVLTLPENKTVEATALNTPVEIGTATATDIFGVTVTSDAPVSYPIGAATVTWTATDANGNVSTAVQTITIVDTTKPVLTLPENKTVEATALNTPVEIGTATATDIFGVTVTSDAPVSYPIGATTVTWTATDANGNVSTAVQTITIVDTTKPVLTAPADITVYATGITTQVSIGNATTTDIFEVTVTNDALAEYPVGTTLVTWTATDANGNVSTAVQSITVLQKLNLTAYNCDRSVTTDKLEPIIKLENVSGNTLNLSDITIRYYYTVDDEMYQHYSCYNAKVYNDLGYSIITSNVGGTLIQSIEKPGSDYYLEISFTSSAGELKQGEEVIIHNQIIKDFWGCYTQTNDYSFNASANNYVETDKITVNLSGTLVNGIEP